MSMHLARTRQRDAGRDGDWREANLEEDYAIGEKIDGWKWRMNEEMSSWRFADARIFHLKR